MKLFLKFILSLLIFTVLTALTQIGGIVYLLALWISKKTAFRFPFKTTLLFAVLYLGATYVLVPLLAPLFGRERVDDNENLQAVNSATVFLNRNYVTPELNALLLYVCSDDKLMKRSIKVRYLDACFPFYDGFPLLPHMSHRDGKKIDLSFVYENEKGEIVNKSRSRSGYGVFEEPIKKEFNQTENCIKKGYWQYDYPKYLTLGEINEELRLSKKGTALLLKAILRNDAVGKVFIEPHLKKRLGLRDKRIRFQGCNSVRHDDHIHLQLK